MESKQANPLTDVGTRVKARARGLLEMQYTTTEIAEILGVNRHTILAVWIAAGLPYSKDDKGRYWFVGSEVNRWLSSFTSPSRRGAALPGSCYCMKCRESVIPLDLKPHETHSTIKINMLQGHCPNCGAQVVRVNGSKGGAW